MRDVDKIIAKLGLQPLPEEGGFFARTWTGNPASEGNRADGTAIYFLLTTDAFSAFHRLERDEIWHFYAGATIEHWQLSPTDGTAHRALLGPNILGDEIPQLVVPSGHWQGARLFAAPPHVRPENNSWSLVGCTLAPGWLNEEFSLGDRAELSRLFPTAADIISALTRI